MEKSPIKSIVCPVAKGASEAPGRTALMDGTISLTYRQLDAAVVATITRLRGLGVKPGDVAAILDFNSIRYAILLYAAFRMGFTLMPLNIRLNKSDWRRQIDQAGCRLVIYGDKYKSGISQLDIESISIDKVISADGAGLQTPDLRELELDRPGVIIFSSGTAGESRGVVLTWKNLYYSALGIESVLSYGSDDRWLAVLPFFHIGGISIPFRTALAGCGSYIMNRFDPKKVINIVEKEPIHYLSVVPSMLRDLIREDKHDSLKKLKAIIVGGAAYNKLLQDEARPRALPIQTTYGMTETSSMVTLLPITDISKKTETAGRALPYRELKITDEKGSELPSGETGRIKVRGEVMFSQYLNREDSALDSDGWFDTGDIGRLDDENYLIFTGRSDRIIISGGENINPAHVEETLGRMEGVSGVVVMSRSSARWGERPVAFVETSTGRLTERGIKEALRGKLPSLMIPDRIIIVDNLPLTGSGKYDRRSLKRKYRSIFEIDD